jgi:hypothetical protein
VLDLLKSELEEAAFMLVDDASRKDIHSKLVNCLVILEQVKSGIATTTVSSNATERDEINKVKRRLRMWAKPERQEQYNSKILNGYLELARSGKHEITEEELRTTVGGESWFWPNFNQMKAIADRNHGKVFEVNGQYVSIWPPVRFAVKEYETRVFSSM